ncbi:MAG: ComF family protein [Lentisphaeria bacterium]|nr:ComF family protein [Lentisphaeria bacterium]
MNIFRYISSELNLLSCPACGTGNGSGINDLCEECRSKLIFFSGRCCKNCGGELDGVLHCCSKCLREGERPYLEAVSVFAYCGEGKDFVLDFKSNHILPYGRIFAKMLSERIKQHKNWDFDIIVPVPLHWTRKLSRTFNQSELVAKFMADNLMRHCCPAALRRVTHTRSQKFLSDKERHKNLQGAFQADSNSVKNKKILLVDDIFTTGATMSAAAEALLNAGAKCVYAASIARA